jgi:hypothetical protein
MSRTCGIEIGDMLGEFSGASLGDTRLDERL